MDVVARLAAEPPQTVLGWGAQRLLSSPFHVSVAHAWDDIGDCAACQCPSRQRSVRHRNGLHRTRLLPAVQFRFPLIKAGGFCRQRGMVAFRRHQQTFQQPVILKLTRHFSVSSDCSPPDSIKRATADACGRCTIRSMHDSASFSVKTACQMQESSHRQQSDTSQCDL